MKSLKPINGKVEYKVPKQNKTAGGIYLAVQSEKDKSTGLVVAVADEVEKVKVEDRILVDKYASAPIDEDDNHYYYLCDEDDIYAIVMEE